MVICASRKLLLLSSDGDVSRLPFCFASVCTIVVIDPLFSVPLPPIFVLRLAISRRHFDSLQELWQVWTASKRVNFTLKRSMAVDDGESRINAINA
jgi:hypothetical protein